MKADDRTGCLSGGEPCPRPRAESRRFCLPCCAVLDRVGRELSYHHVPRFTTEAATSAFKAARKAERDAKAADAAADEADTVPEKYRPTMCSVIGCAKNHREDSTLCYRHRGLAENATAVENACAVDGCERVATPTGRCKRHPLKAAALAGAV